MKYYVKVVDDDENVVLSIGVHNLDLAKRTENAMSEDIRSMST